MSPTATPPPFKAYIYLTQLKLLSCITLLENFIFVCSLGIKVKRVSASEVFFFDSNELQLKINKKVKSKKRI